MASGDGGNALVLTPETAPAPQPRRRPRRRKGGHEYSSEFEQVASLYPRTDGKWAASRKFEELAPEYGGRELLRDRIVGALLWQVVLTQWKRDGGRYVPHLATYLHQRLFLDAKPTDETAFMDPALLTPAARQRWESAQAARKRVARERKAEAEERRQIAAEPTPREHVLRWALDWTADQANHDAPLPPIKAEDQQVWGEAIVQRLREFKAAGMRRAQLPVWARQWLDVHHPQPGSAPPPAASNEPEKREVPPPPALPCDAARLTTALADRLSMQPEAPRAAPAAPPQRVARW